MSDAFINDLKEANVFNAWENKLNNLNINKYQLTPDPDDEVWNDAVLEARGYGISIAAFGDTVDKIVITPTNFGYAFDYFWGNGNWSSESCWDSNVSQDLRHKAYIQLAIFARIASKHYKVRVLFPDGNAKGYLSSTLVDASEEVLKNLEHEKQDVVLFIYGISNIMS